MTPPELAEELLGVELKPWQRRHVNDAVAQRQRKQLAERELAAIAHLDHDLEPTCEWRLRDGHECGAAASWLWACRACGTSATICDPHQLEQTRRVTGHTLICHRCTASGPWPMVFRWIPIGGAR